MDETTSHGDRHGVRFWQRTYTDQHGWVWKGLKKFSDLKVQSVALQSLSSAARKQ
jgi:hypothetical protein